MIWGSGLLGALVSHTWQCAYCGCHCCQAVPKPMGLLSNYFRHNDSFELLRLIIIIPNNFTMLVYAAGPKNVLYQLRFINIHGLHCIPEWWYLLSPQPSGCIMGAKPTLSRYIISQYSAKCTSKAKWERKLILKFVTTECKKDPYYSTFSAKRSMQTRLRRFLALASED